MKKYVTTRKSVCGGRLLKIDSMLVKMLKDNEHSKEQFIKQDINVSGYRASFCRGMLFNINEDGLANDLIYTTPTNYYIKGIESKIAVESQFMIENYVELEELLKYEGYGIDLTQADLNQIFKKYIINNLWLLNNLEIFGCKKVHNKNTNFFMICESGKPQIISKDICEKLSMINCSQNGKPHPEEPGYSLIKRIR